MGKLKSLAASVEQSASGKTGADATRLTELAEILKNPSR
jgi:hypothetical protein